MSNKTIKSLLILLVLILMITPSCSKQSLNVESKEYNQKFFVEWDSYLAMFSDEQINIDLSFIEFNKNEKRKKDSTAEKYKFVSENGIEYPVTLINEIESEVEREYSLLTYVLRISGLSIGEHSLTEFVIEDSENEFTYNIGQIKVDVIDSGKRYDEISLGKHSVQGSVFDWYRSEMKNETINNICIADMYINLSILVDIDITASRDFNNFDNPVDRCLNANETKAFEFQFQYDETINEFVSIKPIVRIKNEDKILIMPRVVYSKPFKSHEEIINLINNLGTN
ncbi:hypothetical protein ACX93W_15960 [Paenibacillus sp. CAU 1782]